MAGSHKLTLLCIGVKLKVLADAAENYNAILAENRKMFNELQDLKGATTYSGSITLDLSIVFEIKSEFS
jgi:hypothetical protein